MHSFASLRLLFPRCILEQACLPNDPLVSIESACKNGDSATVAQQNHAVRDGEISSRKFNGTSSLCCEIWRPRRVSCSLLSLYNLQMCRRLLETYGFIKQSDCAEVDLGDKQTAKTVQCQTSCTSCQFYMLLWALLAAFKPYNKSSLE